MCCKDPAHKFHVGLRNHSPLATRLCTLYARNFLLAPFIHLILHLPQSETHPTYLPLLPLHQSPLEAVYSHTYIMVRRNRLKASRIPTALLDLSEQTTGSTHDRAHSSSMKVQPPSDSTSYKKSRLTTSQRTTTSSRESQLLPMTS